MGPDQPQDYAPEHTCDCRKLGDRRSATDAQMQLVQHLGDVKGLLSTHIERMEHMGLMVTAHEHWMEGTPAAPGAKYHVARWVARDKLRGRIMLLLVAGLATAAGAQWFKPATEALKLWLQS